MKNIVTKFINRRSVKSVITVLFLGFSVSAAMATTITLVNLDGPGEGFNDASAPFPNQTNNTASTLGEQRLNVFQAAADFWEERLVSSVEILVDINMDPLSCDAFSGTLGSAGPLSADINFPNAPLTNVIYVIALANSLSGSDGSIGISDIGATFNLDIDNNDDCLFGTNWWLGIDAPAPPGTISLYDTVLHEIAHGLGVVSFTALTDDEGDPDDPTDDVLAGDFVIIGLPFSYDVNLRDDGLGLTFPQMTRAQRAAAVTNTGNLVWNGNSANNNSDHLEESSRTNERIRMYAPSEVEPGSSVSHWDTALTPNELMEPFATGSNDERSTLQMLEDIGWVIQVPDGVAPEVEDNFLLDFLPSIIRASESQR